MSRAATGRGAGVAGAGVVGVDVGGGGCLAGVGGAGRPVRFSSRR